jgi:predicted nucleotide-binding protein
MALNPSLVEFFITRIQNANMNSIVGVASQLFEHLGTEIKDNPVYDNYEKSVSRWLEWIGLQFDDVQLPKKFEDSKSLAYSVFKKIAELDEPFSFLYKLTGEGKFYESIVYLNQFYTEYLEKALEDIINANPEFEKGEVQKVIGNKVFIVHGHNDLIKTQVQLLLSRAGVNNIVLHEQPDKGRTIIDKLINEGENSNYAIALLSPDDIVNTGEKRARQNVVLEIGYFMGRLGKERIRLLIQDQVEIPSDLNGILYEKYDNSGAWKMKILKELQAVGIYVNFENVLQSI